MSIMKAVIKRVYRWVKVVGMGGFSLHVPQMASQLMQGWFSFIIFVVYYCTVPCRFLFLRLVTFDQCLLSLLLAKA